MSTPQDPAQPAAARGLSASALLWAGLGLALAHLALLLDNAGARQGDPSFVQSALGCLLLISPGLGPALFLLCRRGAAGSPCTI